MQETSTPREQSITAENITEIKKAFNNAMEVARKYLGEQVRGEWYLAETKRVNIIQLYMCDEKSRWNTAESGVIIPALNGDIVVMDDSMPF